MSSARPDLKFSDSSDERNFYKKFTQLPPKPNPDATLRIIDNRDYYILIEEDAIAVAETIYKTLAVIKTSTSFGKTYKYLTLSPAVLANVLKIFVVAMNFKVEIYDKNNQFSMIHLITPGNYLESIEDLNIAGAAVTADDVSVSAAAPITAALKYRTNAKDGSLNFGVCFIDLFNKEIGLCEFIDNEHFGNLESCLLQLGVKECIVQAAKDDLSAKLRQVIDRIGIVISESSARTSTDDGSIESDLLKLVDEEYHGVVVTANGKNQQDTLRLAFHASHLLMSYLNLLNSDANQGIYKLFQHNLSSFVKLDSSTVKALNIFPNPSTASSSPATSSLFGLLNKCKSMAGSRLLSTWLKQPLTNVREINERLNLVETLINDQQLLLSLVNDNLSMVPDLKKIIKKILAATEMYGNNSRARATLEDVVRIYQLIIKLPDFLATLEYGVGDVDANNETETEAKKDLVQRFWMAPLTECNLHLVKLQELIETTIDLEALDNHEFIIKPEFDDELLTIRDQIQQVNNEIAQIHSQAADDLNIDGAKLKLDSHQQHGWCLRLTRIDSAVLRKSSAKFIELQTIKAGVFFTNKELKAKSEEYRVLNADYEAKQSVLVKEIIGITASYTPILNKLSEVLAHLDVICAFANVSTTVAPIPYVKPTITTFASDADAKVVLKDSRHPLLELQDDVSFIANDIELVRDEQDFLIITGPNMGGKSTYIRQLGCISLLAQCGCFVPCSSAELSIFDCILSRVGASDSQLKGLSTFMAEMLETSNILRQATANSLIIIDELGRGTSTYDGFGLAYAISEHIATTLRCFTLFATHFHELTALSTKISSIKNYHVVAHINEKETPMDGVKNDDITLLYKVEPGISDQSFGIHVAELVKFPTKIVNMAKRKASELEDYVNGDISDARQREEDPYIKDKKTKCSPAEISKGEAALKEILIAWKAQVGESYTSAEAVQVLKEVFEARREEAENNKFLQEIVSML
ncbi:hypothetical protein BABINDRAFT_161623 [Babjeviella inositovora NRRL Y-12698]|uniref:DNA mismatch repair protein MSH2 n=1 Tax=Babjeviella inositovora NRRL Y-12698 TaxID=984486 RepID=A0A1E3QQM9_9ASCO|nr:uncharacterized protein BABINDRAFT_161623 [Babjeviella inositovora NRRL Y-12698]ODQ79960.1 hypothetical protein BABINDRAFT_161623 [Babjeviella inositovora NRRL Y-12698]